MNNFNMQRILLEKSNKRKKVSPPGKREYDYYLVSEDGFIKWYNKLGLDDYTTFDIVLKDTGEIVFEKNKTRRKVLKSRGTKKYDEYGDKSFESIKAKAKAKFDAPLIFDTYDTEEFYSIKKEDIHKTIGEDPEEFGNKTNYDTFGIMPTEMKRRDGLSFKENDLTNLKWYIQKWNSENQQSSGGIKIVLVGAKLGSKVAKTDVQFT